MSVLLVDGDNLLNIGFYGVKNYFYKGVHIGGIFHFLNTLRKSFETHNHDKIVVFWDGEEGSSTRRKIYEKYKTNRINKLTEEEVSSYNYQRNRIKQYLEELYVRQGEFKYCETDDCIAYYCQQSPYENKIIYSTDGDLTQLVSETTSIYNPKHNKLYKNNDIIEYKKESILIDNVKLVKILCGDPSDNIDGIQGLGVKTMLSLFPELKNRRLEISQLKEQAVLLNEYKKSKTLENFLSGKTKNGVLGDNFFYINEKIVSLHEPFLTDEAKETIIQLIRENLDPEGRSYKNTLKFMMEDGIFQVLPKTDDRWIQFLNPFLRLSRKEKNKVYQTTKRYANSNKF